MSGDSLTYSLKGHGWADLEISIGGETRLIEGISYCTNAFDDLIRMGLQIATDTGFACVLFDHEPATTILVAETGWWAGSDWIVGARLGAIEGATHDVREPTWSSIKDIPRQFEFTIGSRDALARLFLDMAKKVEREYGVDGYEERWAGDLGFPVRAMAALERALSVEPRGAPHYA